MSQAIQKLADRARGAETRLTRFRQRVKERQTLQIGVGALVGGGSAFLMGWLDGRFRRGVASGIEIGPVPLTPVVGGLLIAVAAFDVLPMSYWVGRIGAGMGEGWLYQQGFRMGT